MTLKEHYKNRLFSNLSESGPRIYVGRGEWESLTPQSDRPSFSGKDKRDERWTPPAGYTVPKSSQPFSSFLSSPKTPSTYTRVPSAERIAADAAADKAELEAKRSTTRRLLNTVHHFSREHGIQLGPEHIEGIDFTDPNIDVQSHIRTISSRLGL